MPHCKSCGALLNENEISCPSCGMLVPKKDSSEMQLETAHPNTTEQPMPTCQTCGNPAQAENGPAFLWGLLGFFIPIAGLILFLIWKDTKPKSAKAAVIGTLVNIIFCVVLCILFIIALGIFSIWVQDAISGLQYIG